MLTTTTKEPPPHSTLRMCHEIGRNSKSDHFRSYLSFKQNSTKNDLLAKEIFLGRKKKTNPCCLCCCSLHQRLSRFTLSTNHESMNSTTLFSTPDTNSLFTPVAQTVPSLYSFENYFNHVLPCYKFTESSCEMCHLPQCLVWSVCFSPTCEHFIGGGH